MPISASTPVTQASLEPPAMQDLRMAAGVVSPLHRRKLRITSREISKVIFGFVSGQVITSVIVMISACIVLSLCLAFHVLENYLIVPKVYGKNLRLSTQSR